MMCANEEKKERLKKGERKRGKWREKERKWKQVFRTPGRCSPNSPRVHNTTSSMQSSGSEPGPGRTHCFTRRLFIASCEAFMCTAEASHVHTTPSPVDLEDSFLGKRRKLQPL